MLARLEPLRQDLDTNSTEMIADALQHIGADFAQKQDHPMALKWLKRAQQTINSSDIDELSVDGLEIRLAICQSLFRALLSQMTPEALQEAEELVSLMEDQVGDKPVVLHWRLEILQKVPKEEFNAQAYASILRRMVRAFDCSDETFRFLLHHIKELREMSATLACGLLDEFMLQRVIPSGKTDYIAKTLVRRVWLVVMGDGSMNTLSNLEKLLTTTYDATFKPVEPDVAGAAQSVRVT